MKYKSLKLTHVDGKMHHLGITENDIAQNVIIPQTPEDVVSVAKLFDFAENKGQWREYLTYTGKVQNTPISVMSSGMGCMPMAITVEELKHVGAKNLIKIGTGAAIQPGIKPGTLFISSSAVRSEGATLEYINYRYPGIANIDAINALVSAAEDFGEKPIVGMFRSHDAVYLEDDPESVEFWKELKVDFVEGETSALLTIAALLRGLKAASICVAIANYTEGTEIEEEELKERLEICSKIAIKALQILNGC